jgi:hypothetical protein
MNKSESTLANAISEILSAIVDDLKSLKSANGSNHADVANCANSGKGEVPQETTDQPSDRAGDVCSETRLERQNEQTKKPCTCGQSSLQNECDNTCFYFEEFE